MGKLRKIDKETKHLTGRIYLSGDENIRFSSSEETFLRALERKILESAKDFKHAGITVDFFELEIK